ncbi:MAG: phage portal protein [Phycisphaeraceae bacterium]|nr:phage portal protein [Phycisphaeraceae bacterium]
MPPTQPSTPPHAPGEPPISRALINLVIDEHRRRALPRYNLFWSYYRNAMEVTGRAGARTRPYRLAHEATLPFRSGDDDPDTRLRRQSVIENDIAWRIHAMIDFIFGKPLTIRSQAADPHLRARIDAILHAVWDHSGGLALMQDCALLAHVFGHASLGLRLSDHLAALTLDQRRPRLTPDPHDCARHIRLELIDPRRAAPILDDRDYRRLRALILHTTRETNDIIADGASLSPSFAAAPSRRRAATTEVITADSWRIFEDGRAVSSQFFHIADAPPVAHFQNIAQPFEHAGLGEVEPLIPLQDELNARLTDRASRVTMQTFKMFLVKGFDSLNNASVGPGRLWITDNPDAAVEPFGGDASSPSEDRHLADIRDAMDKISGVPPLASGVVQAKVGNLSSANALRITLMSVLSKTARKRITYGRGIAHACELILAALSAADILPTSPQDRRVRLLWPDPLPEDIRERLLTLDAKARFGAPNEQLLAELGHGSDEPEPAR